jgi:hypothetical protein
LVEILQLLVEVILDDTLLKHAQTKAPFDKISESGDRLGSKGFYVLKREASDIQILSWYIGI